MGRQLEGAPDMRRKLRGDGRRTSILAAASLATLLAWCGGVMLACGGSSGGYVPPTDGGPAVDSSIGSDAAPEAAPEAGDGGTEAASTQLQPPACTPASGMTFTGSGSVVLDPPSGFPAGGSLYYTTNGTTPTTSGSPYISGAPITFACSGASCPLTETIQAIAAAPGYQTSTVAACTYTVDASGAVGAPTFTPTVMVQNNDPFLVSIGSDPGATICYRFDGQAPTCDPTQMPATCTGGAQTYNGVTQISVTGADTVQSGATQGQITIQAIACKNGETSSMVVPATYELQAAAPTMVISSGTGSYP